MNKRNYLEAEVTYIKDRTLHQLGLTFLLHIQPEALRPKQAMEQKAQCQKRRINTYDVFVKQLPTVFNETFTEIIWTMKVGINAT